MSIRATIKDWEVITGIRVLDPDGFNRKDPQLMERLFTYQEFTHGMIQSTVQSPRLDLEFADKPVGVLPPKEAKHERPIR